MPLKIITNSLILYIFCTCMHIQVVEKTGSKISSIQKKKNPSREQVEKLTQVISYFLKFKTFKPIIG